MLFLTNYCFFWTEVDSNEGTSFAVAFSPGGHSQFDGELIINARQTADVTIETSTTSEVVTVNGNSSHHHDYPFSMRAVADIEDKGN